ncbi:MAG: hypothetical protein U1A77_11840 [Pirellulales bacterium]
MSSLRKFVAHIQDSLTQLTRQGSRRRQDRRVRSAARSRASRTFRPSGAISLERLEAREVMATAIGMNIDRIADYSPAWVFTDAFQSSRSWVSYSYNTATGAMSQSPQGTAIQVDAQGWPTSLSEWWNEQGQLMQQRLGSGMFTAIDGHYPAGVYRAEWRGTGTLTFGGDARVTARGDMADGTHYALLDVSPTRAGISLRLDSLSPANPVRDIHVWMPDFQGQSFAGQDWTPGASYSPFHPLFTERLDPFHTIRFLQAEAGNSTDEVQWSDRKTVDAARQSTFAADFQNGLAIEYRVELANQLQSNAWFAMPYLANDDYIRNFATMVRDQLDPDLKVYIEWSNEVWNFSPGFESHVWVRDQVGLPTTDPNFWPTFYRIVAQEARRDFDIWSEVFAGQTDRLVRVVSGQAANPWVARQIAQNMQGHFDAIASDSYVTFARPQLEQFNASTTTDQVVAALFDVALPQTLNFLQQHQALANEYSTALGRDIQMLVYEGGVLLPGAGRPYEQVFRATSRDPRMYDLYTQLIEGVNDIGVDLFNAYVYTDTSPFADASHLLYQDQPLSDAHKYRALVDAIHSEEPPPPPPAENLAPVNTVPGEQVVAAGTSLTFAAAHRNAIQVADADAGDSPLRVTVSGTGGVLRLSTTQALDSVMGDGTASVEIVGSLPAINAALEGLTFTSSLTTRGTVVLQVTTDDQGHMGSGGAKQDTDEIPVTVVAPARVASVVIDNGGNQRSMVRRVTVNFDQPVMVDAGAFILTRNDGRLVTLSGYSPGLYSSLTLSFSGELVERSGSLADGNYRLTILSSRIHDRTLGLALDGNADGLAGGDRQDAFFRLFGDSDGDRDVDTIDAWRFFASMGKRRGQSGYVDYFDHNADGQINGLDNVEFTRRLRRRI